MKACPSATVPMLMSIKKQHLVVHEDDHAVTKILKNTLIEEFNRWWELKDRLLESSIYSEAAVLDPRFKKLSFFTDAQRNEANTVYCSGKSGWEPSYQTCTGGRWGQCLGGGVWPCRPFKTKKEKDQVASMLSSDEEEQLSEDSEMMAYLKDTTKSSTWPLEGWQKNEERCPKLSGAAQRIRSIPSTPRPSERVFSTAGFISSKTRSALLMAICQQVGFPRT